MSASAGVTLIGFVVVLALALAALTATGRTYLPSGSRRREQIRGELLYHYCADAEVTIDPAAGTFTKLRRSRTHEPWLLGRRAIYFYVGVAARRPRSNHPRLRHTPAAEVTIAGSELLDAVGGARIWYRRADRAVAVCANYRGPYQGVRRGITLFPRKPKRNRGARDEQHRANSRTAR
jgi:hypothetical protein